MGSRAGSPRVRQLICGRGADVIPPATNNYNYNYKRKVIQ